MSANEWMRLLEVFLVPPGLLVWTGFIVWMLVHIRPRIFSRLFFLALLSTWLLASPWVSQWLLDSLQDDFPPLQEVPADADVIVVLGGGNYPGGEEYGFSTQPGATMLQRLTYAAFLANRHHLPVIVSEARTTSEQHTKTHAGEQFLHDVLGVERVMVEGRARSTFENAKYTAPMLKTYRKPLLVTSYWHMARAMESFMYFGIRPVAAPTGLISQPPGLASYWRWLPHPKTLAESYIALHEYLGYYWYRFGLFSNGAPTAQH